MSLLELALELPAAVFEYVSENAAHGGDEDQRTDDGEPVSEPDGNAGREQTERDGDDAGT
jgi:hypothetical protein